MKKLFAVLIALVLAACASTPQAPVQTAEQMVARVCGPTMIVMTSLLAMDTIAPAQKQKIEDFQPVVTALCDAGSQADLADFRLTVAALVPVMLDAVKTSSLSTEDKQNITISIILVQAVLASLHQ